MCLDGTGSVVGSIVRNWGAAVKDAVREPATRPEQRQWVQLPVHLRPALYPPVFVLVGAWQRCRCAYRFSVPLIHRPWHWWSSFTCLLPKFHRGYIYMICDIGREYDISIRVEISGEPLCPLILLVQTSGLALVCYKMSNHHQKHPTTK